MKYIVKIAVLASGLMVSGLSIASDFLGDLQYRPHDSETTKTLPAYSGRNVVYYHDNSVLPLERENIDTVVSWMDTAMDLYRDYGSLEYRLEGYNCPTPHSEYPAYEHLGSVVLMPSGGYGGLGCSSKSENFITPPNILFEYPMDPRAWDISFYELGRGGPWGELKQYFNAFDPGEEIGKAFPRFVQYQTLEELGVDHDDAIINETWNFTDSSPTKTNIRLQEGPLKEFEYLDFYSFPKGFLKYDGGSKEFRLGDAMAIVFYYLELNYGHEFMKEFFNYARENSFEMKPANGKEAVCNVVRAGNAALRRAKGFQMGNDTVGDFLKEKFRFPDCNEPLDIRINNKFTYAVPGEINILSWDVTGAIDPNSEIRVYVDFGTGWKVQGRYRYYRATAGIKVPENATKFRTYVGVIKSNSWKHWDYEEYPLAPVGIELVDTSKLMRGAGDTRIKWSLNGEINDVSVQIFIDYSGDNEGWTFVKGVDGNVESTYIPMKVGYTSARIFIGLVRKGEWLATDINSYSIVCDENVSSCTL